MVWGASGANAREVCTCFVYCGCDFLTSPQQSSRRGRESEERISLYVLKVASRRWPVSSFGDGPRPTVCEMYGGPGTGGGRSYPGYHRRKGVPGCAAPRVSSAQARPGVWLSHRSGAGSGPGARRYGLSALHATPTPTPPLTPFRNKQQHAIEGQQNSANPLRMLSVQQHDKRGI